MQEEELDEYIELTAPIQLAKILKKSKRTGRDVAEEMRDLFEIPIAVDFISRVNKGIKRNIYSDNIVKLCVVLDCTPNDLIPNPLTSDKKWQ